MGGYPDNGGAGQPQVGGGPKSTEGGKQDSREGSGGGGGVPQGTRVLEHRSGTEKSILGLGSVEMGEFFTGGVGQRSGVSRG